MLDQETSERLDILRFPLMVLVVFIHSYVTFSSMSGGVIGKIYNNFITDFVRNIVSQGFARTAVPLFFLMSGYLFFVGFKSTKVAYLRKIKNRTRTLLIPFLFWNIATLLLIAIAQAMPITKDFFSAGNAPVASFGASDYISAIFGIGRSPISYQFWFIRDLMVLVLLAPAIRIANRYAVLTFIVVLFACWMAGVWPVRTPSVEATLFFSIGALVAASRKSLFAFDKHGTAVIAAYLPIVIADALLMQETFHTYLHKIGIVFGVVAVLYSTKFVATSNRVKRAILSLGGASFFVFAAHEPLLTIARKLTYKILSPESWGLVLSLYFIIPIFVISILVVIYRALLGISPTLVGAVTGGRVSA